MSTSHCTCPSTRRRNGSVELRSVWIVANRRWKALPQQIRDLQELVNALWFRDVGEFNDPEPAATDEESGLTFASALSRNHVTEAVSGCRKAANPSSCEAFESQFLNPAAVNVHRTCLWGASVPVLFFPGAGCPASQAAAFRVAANLPKPKTISSRPATRVGRGPAAMGERNHVSTVSRSMPQFARNFPNITLSLCERSCEWCLFEGHSCVILWTLARSSSLSTLTLSRSCSLPVLASLAQQRKLKCPMLTRLGHNSFVFFFYFFLFATVEQLVKLEFLAQQVELKWLMLNKWRRCFHSSRIKISFCEHVCKLIFRVDVSNMNFGVQI